MNKDDLNITREEIIALRQNYKPNHRQYWTDEEREKIIEMHQAGIGITEMAVIFQRSEAAIFNQINHLGLNRRTRSPNKGSDDCKCPYCSRYGQCQKPCPAQEIDLENIEKPMRNF